MTDLNIICVICNQEVKDDGVTVTKGINTLIKSSIERKDGIHKLLGNVDVVKVHSICRQNYTRPSNIKAALKAQSSEPTSSRHFLRELENTFDFKHECLLCEKNAVFDPKLPSKYRTHIHEVSTIEIKQTLLNACDNRNDDWGCKVKSRLLDVIDLVAAEARYHGQCYKNFCKPIHSEQKVGRPLTAKSVDQFNLLTNYLENDNECQYSLKDLRQILVELSGSDIDYTDYYLKLKLVDFFKERLVVHNLSGKKSILCMSHTSHKVLDSWYKNRESSTEEERKRIVQTAAEIVKEDIQKMNYDCAKYASEQEVSTVSNDLIPETLALFTSTVTKKRTGNSSTDIARKRAVINHTIISTVRPRSFLSSIQSSLSLYLNRMYGSKHLIEVLSALGVCSSYYESDRYIRSLITHGPPVIKSDSFAQYVFDNADVNVRTLDGLNTFHAMGGIACITPSSHVSITSEVPRLLDGSFKVAEEIRKRSYVKRKTSGLACIVMEDFSEAISLRKTNANKVSFIHPLNLLWVSGCNTQPGWNGFMSVSTSKLKGHDTSYILAIPFIDIDPNNPSSVYTALCFAAEQCSITKQTCIVTFDQPLYLKAMEIVAGSEDQSDLSKIIVRLGGFHLLMSYLGCIGRIMEGSGLESLWETVYGKATVKHMLTGHAFARAVRAYILTYAAIVEKVIEEEEDVQVRESVFCNDLHTVYDKLSRSEISHATACDDKAVQSSVSTFTDHINVKKTVSRTSKLWLNLIQQIDLMLNFILAERTGNWQLHLDTTTDMLPYFHAAAHIPYAKSAHIYVQEMNKLKSKLTETEYELFVTKGCFTIRRKEEFWSGNWSDMCIEQSLMKSLKSIGGLTHGRGITESTLNKWVLGAPSFLRISEAFRSFLGLNYNTHEQHVELRESRKSRDLQDLSKFKDWLIQHNPFACSTSELISLSTGLVCDSSVNCDEAYEVGLRAMGSMVGKSFNEIKLHRKDMVTTQASFKAIKVRSKEVSINSQQIFNRIICICDSPVKLKSYFEFELASHPPSLFDETILRKGTKASFMKVFEDGIVEETFNANNSVFVIDGGYLLHAVVWRKNSTFKEIVESYLSYVLHKYGNKVTVVFDGYPDFPTTKQQEQDRRTSKKFSHTILFDENTVCTTQQADFLANPQNKKRLIKAVTTRCVAEGTNVLSAEDDADTTIVDQAIKYVQTNDTTVVVGTDTDLLVLLVALAPQHDGKLYYLKPSPSGTKVYSVDFLIHQHAGQQTSLLFAHSMTGCDTTSAFYGLGKLKAADLIRKSTEAKAQAELFTKQDITKDILLDSGEQFILTMYNLSKFKTLNEARYFKFKQLTAKMSLKSNFDLAKLPPTSDAAHQHLLRVYHQIQTWLGFKLPAEEWGWQYTSNNRLIPKPMTNAPAPNELLLLISCNCKTLCVTNCSCRKAGFDCTSMCGHCSGMHCNNISEQTDEMLENDPI